MSSRWPKVYLIRMDSGRVDFGVRLLGTVLLIACSVGCGDDEAPAGQVVTDVPIVDTAPPDLGPEPDLGPPDIEPPHCPGGFACACLENDDCESGWCIPTRDGTVCTQPCVDSCPSGEWLCKAVAGTVDITYLCVDRYLNLCRPCDTNEECTGLGDVTAPCIKDDNGGFCGGDCTSDTECPADYACQQVTLADGSETSSCKPTVGECTCTVWATLEQASTTCSAAVDELSCTGERMCETGGLTDCDAPIPAAETCNGVDDDCDGATDEGDDGVQLNEVCTDGLCAGERVCEGGAWTVCTAQKSADEICDGLDNDCNGATDEGYDDTDLDEVADCVDSCPDDPNPEQADQDDDGIGNACDPDFQCEEDEDCELNLCLGTAVCDKSGVTPVCAFVGAQVVCPDPSICHKPVCNPVDGSCSEEPVSNGAGCDDQNLCTTGDACLDAACVGGNPTNCDDGLACTEDDCAPAIGCSNLGSDALCDDGFDCTIDLCDPESDCFYTPLDATCNDGVSCTSDACDPAAGCVSAEIDSKCDDNIACTVDVCNAEGGCSQTPDHDFCGATGLCVVAVCSPVSGCLVEVEPSCCGNGLIEDGETCDDGNDAAGDGCTAACAIEDGWECFDEPSICNNCGNGITEGKEACDSGLDPGCGPCLFDCSGPAVVHTGDATVGGAADQVALSEVTAIVGELKVIAPALAALNLPLLECVEGNVRVVGTGALDNLDGLAGMERLTGSLELTNNAALTSLSGLSGIAGAVADLLLKGNTALTSFAGLEKINTVTGALTISGNPEITTLAGLGGLQAISGGLEISSNPKLLLLDGLEALAGAPGALTISNNGVLGTLAALLSINGVVPGAVKIAQNPELVSISGLEGLTGVGGDVSLQWLPLLQNVVPLSGLTSIGGSLTISDVDSIVSMQGLHKVTSLGANLIIKSNPALKDYNGLAALAGPITGYVELRDNDATKNLAPLVNITAVGKYLLIIGNAELTTIAGLSGLESIGQHMQIQANPKLQDLVGLESVTSLGSSIIVHSNVQLDSLAALAGIKQALNGNLQITYNPKLQTLAGLEGITGMAGFMSVDTNPILTDMSALSSVTQVGQAMTIRKTALTDLSGLSGLKKVDTHLRIESNPELTSIESLAGLDGPVGGIFSISDNPKLTTLDGLDGLGGAVSGNMTIGGNKKLLSVDALAGLTSVGGSLVLNGNDAITTFTGLHNIKSVGSFVTIAANKALEFLDLSSLQSVTGKVSVNNNSKLNCQEIGTITQVGASEYVILNNLTPSCD